MSAGMRGKGDNREGGRKLVNSQLLLKDASSCLVLAAVSSLKLLL